MEPMHGQQSMSRRSFSRSYQQSLAQAEQAYDNLLVPDLHRATGVISSGPDRATGPFLRVTSRLLRSKYEE